MCARLLLLLGAAAGEAFCDGIVPSAQAGQLVLVQAEIEWENVGKVPGDALHLFHTALVFLPEQGEPWTVEFRADDFIHAFLPANVLNATTLAELDWKKSVLGACITPGILHGKPHWTVWKPIMHLSSALVADLVHFVLPWTRLGEWSYNLFYIEGEDTQVLQPDLTCAQGALALVAFLEQRGAAVESYGSTSAVPFTTFKLHVDSMEQVGEEEAESILKFYRNVGEGGATTPLRRVVDTFMAFGDTKYVHVRTKAGEAFYRLKMRFPYFSSVYRPRIDFLGEWPENDSPNSLVLV